jgi:hypothetical protein
MGVRCIGLQEDGPPVGGGIYAPRGLYQHCSAAGPYEPFGPFGFESAASRKAQWSAWHLAAQRSSWIESTSGPAAGSPQFSRFPRTAVPSLISYQEEHYDEPRSAGQLLPGSL